MHNSSYNNPELIKLIQTLENLPPEANLLNLEDCLAEFDCETIVKLLKHIPPRFCALSLKWNNLAARNEGDLESIFRAIPSHIDFLDLTGNNLSEKKPFIFKGIPSEVTELNLSWNNFGARNRGEVAEFLAALPTSITTLDLSSNELYKLDKEFIAIFKQLKPSVTELNLSFNDLGYLGLITAFFAIPETVTKADLSSNAFCTITEEELNLVPLPYPTSDLISLDLRLNNPQKSPLLNLIALKGYFSRLTSIYLTTYDVDEMTVEQIRGLKEMAPSITKWYFFDKYGNEIESTQPRQYAKLLSRINNTASRKPQFFLEENKRRKLDSNSSEECSALDRYSFEQI